MRNLIFCSLMSILAFSAENYKNWSDFFFTAEVYIEPICGECMVNPNDAARRGNTRCLIPKWNDGEFYAKGFDFNFSTNEYEEVVGVRNWHYFDWETQIRQCTGPRR